VQFEENDMENLRAISKFQKLSKLDAGRDDKEKIYELYMQKNLK
jgi:hypothetical protein